MTNRLAKVDDATASPLGFKDGSNNATEFTYTNSGNTYYDLNKGIAEVKFNNYLNKPVEVRYSNGNKVQYTYDGGGNKLQTLTIIGGVYTYVDYTGGAVYENGVLQYYSTPEGRAVLNGTDIEYQYAIADHQGNTRVVFSSATPAPVTVTANFEAASNADFQNYSRTGFDLMDHTDAGTTYEYSQMLTGGYNSQVGLAKSYKVYPGDKVKVEAYAKYANATATSGNLSGFAAALLSAFGKAAPAPGETGTPSSALNTWGGLVAGGDGPTSTGPKAFINIVVFDKNYKLLDLAYDKIDASAEQVGASPVVPHDYMMREYTVKEEGYVYMYLSNENATLVDVYFDDVMMTHTKGNVIQYNEYYPWGLQTASSWTRENAKGNNFLANGGTEFNPVTNYYDLDYRNYDPALGRMMQVDPMSGKYSSLSPYNYSFNSPVKHNDPNGADPSDFYFSGTYYTYDDYKPDLAFHSEYIAGIEQSRMGFRDYGESMNAWTGFDEHVDTQMRMNALRSGVSNALTTTGDGIFSISDAGVATQMAKQENLVVFHMTAQTKGYTTNEVYAERFMNTGWMAAIANSDEHLLEILSKFKDKDGKSRLKNLVIVSHGSDDETIPAIVTDAEISSSDFRKGNSDAELIKSIVASVADGGNVVFTACNAGNRNFPLLAAAYSAQGNTNQVNMYFNADPTTFGYAPRDPGRLYFTIPIGKPLSETDTYHGWIQTGIVNGSPVNPVPVSNIILNRNGTINVIPYK